MVQLFIDNVSVDVDQGGTVLDAARKLGIDVPAMCCLAGHAPNTSCMCCLVRVDDSPDFVPSCATLASDGMRVESESRQVHALRKTGIELLLADHAGDCHAPCQNTCPAKMDIPNMLRLVADGDYAAALATVKQDIGATRYSRTGVPRGVRAGLPAGAARQPRGDLQDQTLCCRPRPPVA